MREVEQNSEQLQRIIVKATREVAHESPDHLIPWGTRRDNSTQRRFNQKLYQLFDERRGSLRVLDLGCSGGGFVKDCIDDGCIAVGLEGSDYSKRMRRAEWRTIPEYLFTADITAPFEVIGQFSSGQKRLQFDAITSWEVMEHIHERDLAAVAENVNRHLRPGGLWIMSVTAADDIFNGVNLHQTVKPKDWWVQRFASLGLFHCEKYITYFNTQFLRGSGYMADPRTFHLVLTNDQKLAPAVPKEGFAVRIYDRWLGSTPQRLLKFLICGI